MSTAVTTPSTSSCCGVNCPGTSNSSFSQHNNHQDNDLDALLIQGMRDLSFDELQREQEMHGVCNDDFQEEPEVMDGLMGSLKEELGRIKKGTAYETAEELNPSYATRRDILTIFLRGNRYEPKAAAKQMIKFFDLKQELFGTESLGRDITSKDLTEEDMETLMEGSLQIANCNDRAGRMIAIGFAGLRKSQSPKSELRVRFFQCNYIMKEANSRGCIIISYSIDQYQDKRGGEGFIDAMKLILAMPCNIAGFHLVTDDKSQCNIATLAFSMFPPRVRAKTKIHFGSHQECRYSLTSFGIPGGAIPLDMDNSMNLAHHQSWFQKCQQKEELNEQQELASPSTTAHTLAQNPTPNSATGEKTPKDNDVLCIGRKVNGVGNDRLMAMAMMHAESYDMSSKKGRKAIMDSMIDEEVVKEGGRFLKPSKTDSGTKQWLEVPEKEIYEKLGQMFRNLRRRRTS